MSVDITNSMLTEKALDYAKLSSLAYAEWIKLDDGTWILDPNNTDNDKYKELWDEMFKKGCRVFDYCPNDINTGYSGTIFFNTKTEQYILANRGAELGLDGTPYDAFDYEACFGQIAIGVTPTKQYISMVEFIAKHDLGVFDVTGHSLGGCLSQMAKATYGSAIDEVYTYNSPGAAALSANYSFLRLSETQGRVIVLNKHGVEEEWKQSTWDLYQTYINNINHINGGEVDESNVYNITAKGGVEPIADKGTDIGREVFVDGVGHGIKAMIESLSTGKFYVRDSPTVTIIGSNGNELLKVDDSGYIITQPQIIKLVGGNGNDTIYGGEGGMRRIKELYSRTQQMFVFAVIMVMFACYTGCASGPKPPIELPFAIHKAGATASTELRIPEKGPFVYQFMLKFMHNVGDKADRARDRERVRKLLGSGGKNKWTGKLVDPGIPIAVKITLSVIDSSGEHIFLEKEFSTAGIQANGANNFKRRIDLRELKRSPGLYRVTVQSLKDIPELADVKVFFAIYYPRKG